MTEKTNCAEKSSKNPNNREKSAVIIKTIRKHRVIIAAVLLSISSFAIFLINNTYEQVWYDEALVLHFSGLGWSEMLHEIGFNGAEAHPPLFHAIIKILRYAFGDSLRVLRGFSALCGSLSLVIVFSFVNKLFDFKTAVCTALLFISNPLILAYTKELRMYMMAGLLVCINLSAFYFAVTEGKKRYWIPYFFSALLGLYVHYYFGFTYLICGFYLLFIFISKKSSMKNKIADLLFYCASTALALLSFIPWIPAFLKQRTDMMSATWLEKANVMVLPKIISYFYTSKYGYDTNPYIPAAFIAGFIFIAYIIGVALHIRKNKNPERIVFIVCAFFLPVIVAFVYSIAISSIINFRYFLMYFPFFLIISSYGLTRIKAAFVRYLVLAVFIILTAPSIYAVFTNRFNGTPRDIADSLLEEPNKKDAILAVNSTTFATLNYYLKSAQRLYHYSEFERPDASGISLDKTRTIFSHELHKLYKIFRDNSVIWIIGTDFTEIYAKQLLSYFEERIVDPNRNYGFRVRGETVKLKFKFTYINHSITCLEKVYHDN